MNMNARRRVLGQERSPWETVRHNGFDTYFYYKNASGSVFTPSEDGNILTIVSNGQNKNLAGVIVNPRFVYADIKNKLCRLSWTITCDELDVLDGTNASGNITLNLFSTQSQTTGGLDTYRKAKKDIATYTTFLGSHSAEFVPGEFMSGLTQAAYFGWSIGSRSKTNGLIFRIEKLDFEIHR